MKKLLSVILCLVMVCALLPAAALAADIPEIKVTAPAPMGGKGPDDAKPVLTTTGMHIYAWDWRDSKGNVLSSYSTFKGGETYTLTVVVASTDKFVAGTTKAYINDTEVTWEAFGVDSAKFKADFTAEVEPHIPEIKVTAPTPMGGKGPDDAKPVLTTTGMHIYAWDWRDSEGNVLNSYSTFKGGETYTLTVVVASTDKFVAG
ncbi:MAG: hypothetical protein E7427_00710, partial [Ruminococcaceae bacterium]|nr:hypothetical protein [Oscillospiraceae bacterium]